MKKNTGALALMEKLYYITNQFNLREIIAGGFIGSIYSFDDKYYEDLLQDSAGRIPLFTAPFDQILFNRVRENDPSICFPVALEIDTSFLNLDDIIQLSNETDGRIGFVYLGVIPISTIRSINFLNNENLEEFTARRYSNLKMPKELFYVNTVLGNTKQYSINVIELLRSLPTLATPSAEHFKLIDRVSGAVTLCLYYSKGKKEYLKLIDDHVNSDLHIVPTWFSKGLAPKSEKELAELDSLDDIVFNCVVNVLHTVNSETVNQKVQLLDSVERLVYSLKNSKDKIDFFKRGFEKIRNLLELKEEFAPFPPSSSRQDAMRGLLMFLLRPKHSDILMWRPEETNASYEAILTALAFSGIVIGRKSIEISYKAAHLEAETINYIVAYLSPSQEEKVNTTKKTSKAVKKKNSKSPQLDLLETLIPVDYTDISPSSNSKSLTLKQKFLDGDLNDPELFKSAIVLCKEQNWDTCVITTIYSNTKSDYSLSSLDNELKIVFHGPIEISQQIDVNKFRQNLENWDDTNRICQ